MNHYVRPFVRPSVSSTLTLHLFTEKWSFEQDIVCFNFWYKLSRLLSFLLLVLFMGSFTLFAKEPEKRPDYLSDR